MLRSSGKIYFTIKKCGDNRKKSFYSEMWGNAVWGGLVKILWDSPCARVLWKLFLPKGGSLLRSCWLVGIGLHTGCKVFSGYCCHCWVLGAVIMGCIGVCQEKKKGRFWCEVDAGYLPSGNNEMEVWRQWSGFLLLNCCVWVVILGLGSLGNRVGSLGSWGRNLTAREPPLEQNGLTPMVSIVQIVLAKCRSARAASHQPAFMGSCLTISHMCMPGLPSKWISPCILKF